MKAIVPALDIQKKKSHSQQDIIFNRKIVAPEKLKILVLAGNQIVSEELEFVQRCVNLLKLDLSHNNIQKITPQAGLQRLQKLQVLYLHSNKIETPAAMEGVFALSNLTHLTFWDNPVERLPRVEHLVVNVMPGLKIVGNRVVFVEERSPIFFHVRAPVFIQDSISEGWKAQENSEAQFIKILELQLRYFNNLWVSNNPIVFIQRHWRKALAEKNIGTRQIQKSIGLEAKNSSLLLSQAKLVLQQFFSTWKQHYLSLKTIKASLKHTETEPHDKLFLTYPLKKYLIELRNQRVAYVIKKYVAHIRHKLFMRKMATRIYRQLYRKLHQFGSAPLLFNVAGTNGRSLFYFNRTQTHLVQNFLKILSDNFYWQKQISSCTKIGPAKNYLSIRTVDPETFSVKRAHSVLTYLLWPSMRVVFLKRKKFPAKQKTGYITIKPLYYIKNQNKRVSGQEHKKSARVFKQLEKFAHKQYESSLEYLECSNGEVMAMLVRYIYYHNTAAIRFENRLKKNQIQSLLENYQEPFLTYADVVLERTAAAVRIQQNWRKYLVGKNASESIYAKMKKTRAILRIQRFWRDHIFYHRFSLTKNLLNQLKLFNTSSFLIPCEVYQKLPQICALEANSLYPNLLLTRTASSSIKCFWQMRKPVFTQSLFGPYFPSYLTAYEHRNEVCDVWSVLHLRAQATKISYQGHHYYEFKYESAQEARYRVGLLAVMTYRCRGSAFFVPIARDTLYLETYRLQQYVRMNFIVAVDSLQVKNAILNDSKGKKKQFDNAGASEANKDQLAKIITLRSFKEEGFFVSSQQFRSKLGPKANQQTPYIIQVQFYQKIYQDFPKKYYTNLYCFVTQYTFKLKQEPMPNVAGQLAEQKIEQYGPKKQIAQKAKSRMINQSELNVSRIDMKRLTLYDFGGKKQKPKPEKEKSQSFSRKQIIQLEEVADKRENIQKIKNQGSLKKQEILQKRSNTLKKVKQSSNREKILNSTAMNIKEIERTQELRKKVERIRQMKNRSKNKSILEDQFIQQGNFVMQQQLKMVVMRSKAQSLRVRSKEKSQSVTSKQSETFSKSFFTEQKANQIKIFDVSNMPKTVPHSLGATFTLHQQTQKTVQGDERKIVNARRTKRSKSRSIGAYIRDPSFVHGVFPEQFYPIETKQGAFKFLPPLP